MRPNVDSPAYKTAISVEKMRLSDAYTIENFVESKELMYRAARGIYDAAKWQGKRIAIVCGGGNNGGDGYALACILADHGIIADVLQVTEKLSKDGEYYVNLATKKGITIRAFEEDADLQGYDMVVDCIFGTGFHGEPRGLAAAAIRAMNDSAAFVISADINSGMNGDTGEAVLAVRSDLTVSIGFYKTGHFLGRAEDLIGDLVNVDIGIILLPDGQ